MHSDDGKVPFLRKVSTRTQPSNAEMKRIGSNTPLFRGTGPEELSMLLGGTVAIANTGATTATTVATANGATAVAEKVETAVASASPVVVDETKSQETVRAGVHMDAMAFGMGCCCLQITFQAKDIDESRFIYDQLAVMAPM